MKHVLLFFSLIWYVAGLCLTVFVSAKLAIAPDYVISLVPIPFILVILFGVLAFSISAARLFSPTLRLYQHVLFWKKENRELNKDEYRTKLAEGQVIYNIFITTCFASCWLLVPLPFYAMSWVFINKYVCDMRPDC